MPWDKYEPMSSGRYGDEGGKWVPKQCKDPEHSPPSMEYLPPGHYVWKCPTCGKITTINVPLVTLRT